MKFRTQICVCLCLILACSCGTERKVSTGDEGLWVLVSRDDFEGASIHITPPPTLEVRTETIRYSGMVGWDIKLTGTEKDGGELLRGAVTLASGIQIPFKTVSPFHRQTIRLSINKEGKPIQRAERRALQF